MKKKFTSFPKMWIFINGNIYVLKSPLTIQELLEWLNFDHTPLIIEYNQKILSKTTLNSIFLQNLDRLELITIVGGG